MRKISENIYSIDGSVHGFALIKDAYALLIDAPETPDDPGYARTLGELGVIKVERVLLTQHRRAHSGGLNALLALSDPPEVFATEAEALLLRNASAVWHSNAGKYHRYACLPDRFSPFEDIHVDVMVRDMLAFDWRGFTITPVVFGALSNGDCAYVVQNDQMSVAFCGALIMAGGKTHDLYSMQKALPDMMGYHGYLGGLVAWREGMRRLLTKKPDILAPAYGEIVRDPANCIALADARYMNYARAYTRISAVRYYFPDEFMRGFQEPLGLTDMPPAAPHVEPLKWLYRIGETTSYILRSPTGHAILIDTGDYKAIEYVSALLETGELTTLDACFITHAHDDHLNNAWALTTLIGCELISTAAVDEVLCQPEAWFLPALPDCRLKLRVLDDMESWEWQGFTLTALNFTGQYMYHAGLIVSLGNEKVLLCGDSFAPTGLDDYCAENRNLPEMGRGYRYCVRLLREHGLRTLINEHQSQPFYYDETYLNMLDTGMDEREACLRELLPGDIGLGIDPQWLRCYPMEQIVTRGATLRVSLQVTGHGRHAIRARARLPWKSDDSYEVSTRTDGLTSGSVCVKLADMPCDTWLHIDIPLTDAPRGEHMLAFDCWLDSEYIGTYANCLIRIL